MYRFYINRAKNIYRFAELIRVFLDDSEYETVSLDFDDASQLVLGDKSYLVNRDGDRNQEAIKRELYTLLAGLTGESSKWGTLTGVRPLKPMLSAYEEYGSIKSAERSMKERYLVSDEKAALLGEIAEYQREYPAGVPYDKTSLYVGIPFCPTRCTYCSFSSAVVSDERISEYLGLLKEEIRYTGGLLKGRTSIPRSIESVYVGGGTPTTLTSSQLEILIDTLCEGLSINPEDIEFTVEAGRPDTLDEDKLHALRACGIGRISINPQSLNDDTLRLIGRKHSSDDIRRAYSQAASAGFKTVNADIIAGLPGETEADFSDTLSELPDLGANNITVHTLSVKRGSPLHESDPQYFRKCGADVSGMLDSAADVLRDRGYRPYYIYRQKHQIDSLENVGWCLPGSHSIYNIRIMEDMQTVIGLGAGAVGKVYYPDENRIERIPNFANHEVYIDRFDEVLSRKRGYFTYDNQRAEGN